MMVVLAAESTAVPAAGWAAVPEQLHYNIGGGGIAYQQLWRHAIPIVHASLGGTSLQLSYSFTDMPHHSCMPHRVTLPAVLMQLYMGVLPRDSLPVVLMVLAVLLVRPLPFRMLASANGCPS